LSHVRQLTVFGGETLFSNLAGNFGVTVGDDGVTVNSVPFSRCFDESKTFRLFVLTFSQIMTCFINVSGANLREQTGHKSSFRLGGGISMKISFIC
jgi:hypothetical protein